MGKLSSKWGWCVFILWACLNSVVVFGATPIEPSCVFTWKVGGLSDITRFEMRHGTVSGGPYDELTLIDDGNAREITCADLDSWGAVGVHAVKLKVLGVDGLLAESDEVVYEVVSAEREFCIVGTVNGQEVKVCVPIILK